MKQVQPYNNLFCHLNKNPKCFHKAIKQTICFYVTLSLILISYRVQEKVGKDEEKDDYKTVFLLMNLFSV